MKVTQVYYTLIYEALGLSMVDVDLSPPPTDNNTQRMKRRIVQPLKHTTSTITTTTDVLISPENQLLLSTSTNNQTFKETHKQKIHQIYHDFKNDIIVQLVKFDEDVQWVKQTDEDSEFIQRFRNQYKTNVLKCIEICETKNRKRREPKPIDLLLNDEVLSLILSKYSTTFIHNQMKILNFNSRNITEIDPLFETLFHHLTELSLSCNQIQTVEHVPKSVQVLQLVSNQIHTIRSLPTNQLILLGLSYNYLTSLNHICNCGTTLVSLDLSFNHFTDFQYMLKELKSLKQLKILSLKGNVFCLLNHYFSSMVQSLPNVLVYDGIRINRDENDKNNNHPQLLKILYERMLNSEHFVSIVLELQSITGLPFESEITYLPTDKDDKRMNELLVNYRKELEIQQQQQQLLLQQQQQLEQQSKSAKNKKKPVPTSKKKQDDSALVNVPDVLIYEKSIEYYLQIDSLLKDCIQVGYSSDGMSIVGFQDVDQQPKTTYTIRSEFKAQQEKRIQYNNLCVLNVMNDRLALELRTFILQPLQLKIMKRTSITGRVQNEPAITPELLHDKHEIVGVSYVDISSFVNGNTFPFLLSSVEDVEKTEQQQQQPLLLPTTTEEERMKVICEENLVYDVLPFPSQTIKGLTVQATVSLNLPSDQIQDRIAKYSTLNNTITSPTTNNTSTPTTTTTTETRKSTKSSTRKK